MKYSDLVSTVALLCMWFPILVDLFAGGIDIQIGIWGGLSSIAVFNILFIVRWGN